MATNAITLNGSSQWATLANFAAIDALTDGTLTIEMWFNQDSSGSSEYAGIFTLTRDQNVDDVCYLDTENAGSSTGVNFGYIYSSTSADGYHDTGLWTNTNWVHIAAVYQNGQKTKVYVNGSEISYNLQNTPSGTVADTAGAHFSMGLGYNGVGDGIFQGKMGGFFRVWADVRTPTEISTNKDLGLQASGEDQLIVNVKFSEGSGTSSVNEASPGNDLSFTGSPSWTTGPTISEKSYGGGGGFPEWPILNGVANFWGPNYA